MVLKWLVNLTGNSGSQLPAIGATSKVEEQARFDRGTGAGNNALKDFDANFPRWPARSTSTRSLQTLCGTSISASDRVAAKVDYTPVGGSISPPHPAKLGEAVLVDRLVHLRQERRTLPPVQPPAPPLIPFLPPTLPPAALVLPAQVAALAPTLEALLYPTPPKETTATLVYADFLYVGPFRAAINPAFLHAHGITDVLSVGARTSPRLAYRVKGVTYHEISALLRLHDRRESSILEDGIIEQAGQIIGKVAKSRRGYVYASALGRKRRKILVHCAKGISRSPSVAIGYLIMFERLSASEAYRNVKERRPIISPRSNFLAQLLELEKIVHGVEVF